jgi:phage terminase large subunit-like protein
VRNGRARRWRSVYFDEEPDIDVYTEGLTRTNETGGIVYITFTPLLGVSEVVRRFPHEKSPDRAVITARRNQPEEFLLTIPSSKKWPATRSRWPR